MLLVACFNNSCKDHVFFYIFFCIICVKSRSTSSRFYYIVEQKYIFVKLIGAWIFLANIPFLLHCLLFLQYKFPHFPTITQTGTFSFSLWRFELLEVKCTSLLRNDHHSPILSFVTMTKLLPITTLSIYIVTCINLKKCMFRANLLFWVAIFKHLCDCRFLFTIIMHIVITNLQ